ncbi:sensor histidine kinase [Inhella sp.]|uniref:sensor histidine kinase n=1 Tax=Inhella sp. TaxID=1921806 RepID=UPI0035B32AE1
MQRRLMLAFAAFTLLVAGLFGLFAMFFVYNVEDRVFERQLHQEAAWLRAQHAAQGSWPAPRGPGMQWVARRAELPDGLPALLAKEPQRREAAGDQGRHYHLALLQDGDGPWLMMEVSDQLLVRPLRGGMLGWLAMWGAGAVLFALLLAVWLARHTARPLQRLAGTLAAARADNLPQQLPGRERSDEVGTLARSVEALLARTRDFLAREQAFTHDASHELRTPLTVLRLGLEKQVAEGGTRAELLLLRSAVLDMAQTLDTLLQLAREGEQPRPEPGGTALLPLVEQWALTHADWLDEQALTLDIQLQRGDRLAVAAPVLRLVLANLLGNAFRHGQRGGVVQVTLEQGRLCIANPVDGEPGEQGWGLGIVRRLLAGQGAELRLKTELGVLCAQVGQAP